MKKYIALGLATMGIVGVFIFIITNFAEAVGRSNVFVGNSTATATSTHQFLSNTATASSSLTSQLNSAEQFSLQMCTTASSSAAILDYEIYFGMKDAAEVAAQTATTTWFQEVVASSTSAGSLSLSERITHTISLATTTSTGTTTCTSEVFNSNSAKQVKVSYGVRGAPTSLWLSIVPRLGY